MQLCDPDTEHIWVLNYVFAWSRANWDKIMTWTYPAKINLSCSVVPLTDFNEAYKLFIVALR